MEQDLQSVHFSSIHADTLIWTEKTIPDSGERLMGQQHSFQQMNNRVSANSSQKNKFDELLRVHMKPDYGSLGEFMTDMNLNTDLLRQKKKKNESQEELQEKRIRHQLRHKNLHNVISSEKSTQIQRNIACRILIEESFKDTFGQSISSFYSNNSKPQSESQQKLINLSSLSHALDSALASKTEQQIEEENEGLNYLKNNFQKNRSSIRGRSRQSKERESLFKIIHELKSKYRTLSKLPEQMSQNNCEALEELKTKYHCEGNKAQVSNNDQPPALLSNNGHNSSKFKPQNSQPLNLNESTSPKFDDLPACFSLTDKSIRIQNLTNENISINNFLSTLCGVNFQLLQHVTIINTVVPLDILLLLCDLILQLSPKIKEVAFENVFKDQNRNEKNNEKLISKVKMLLEAKPIESLRLNRIGLQTKDFCVLCLGIGSSRTLNLAEFKNNAIDESGKKSYEVIMKFFKGLSLNLEGNPIMAELIKSNLLRKAPSLRGTISIPPSSRR